MLAEWKNDDQFKADRGLAEKHCFRRASHIKGMDILSLHQRYVCVFVLVFVCMPGDATKDRCQSNASGSVKGQMYVCVAVCWWHMDTFITLVCLWKGSFGHLMEAFWWMCVIPDWISFLSSRTLCPQTNPKEFVCNLLSTRALRQCLGITFVHVHNRQF